MGSVSQLYKHRSQFQTVRSFCSQRQSLNPETVLNRRALTLITRRKKSLNRIGSDLEIRVGMVGQVIRDMLEKLMKENAEVVGVWMTDEEGVEEKREERDVRTAAESVGTKFKLFTDEKYYVDE